MRSQSPTLVLKDLFPKQDDRLPSSPSNDIEPYLGGTLADLLTNQVGIHINGAHSHPGSELSYFIRGGNNRQVLVLINGSACE